MKSITKKRRRRVVTSVFSQGFQAKGYGIFDGMLPSKNPSNDDDKWACVWITINPFATDINPCKIPAIYIWSVDITAVHHLPKN